MSDGWAISVVQRFAARPEPCLITAETRYEGGKARLELKVNDVIVAVCERIVVPLLPQAELQVIDYTCSCWRCTDRTESRYRLQYGCNSCGTTWLGEIRWGDNPPVSAECPGCGTKHMTYYKPNLIKVEPELSDARWDDDSD